MWVISALIGLVLINNIFGITYIINPNSGPSLSESVNRLKPGDTLLLKEGYYHDSVIIKDLQGTPSSPIVISAYPGDSVTIDGTVPIEGVWEKNNDSIYKIQLTRDIWQLFADGEPQTSARWPNAFWYDETIWDQNYWACGTKEDEKGHHFNVPNVRYGIDLAESGLDMTNALAILNIRNHITYCQPVTSHSPGQGDFYFKSDIIWDNLKIPTTPWNRYYFEGKLELLDAPSEWFFDKTAKELYLFPTDGKKPSEMEIRGKVQTYAFTFENCSNVKIQSLNFFGTTLKMMDCKNSTLEDCNFKYPSYSKRMLGNIQIPEVTHIGNSARRPMLEAANFSLRNCTFAYSDGMGLHLQGKGNTIDNVLFHHIDYSCINPSNDGSAQYGGDNGGIKVIDNTDLHLRRITAHTMGNSNAIMSARWYPDKPNDRVLIELCHVYNLGLVQVQDGSGFQLWQFTGGGKYTTVRNSWAHDTYKFGFRIDGEFENPVHNIQSTFQNLVTWNIYKEDMFMPTGNFVNRFNTGIVVKGDQHHIYNNTALDFNRDDFRNHPSLGIRSFTGGNKNTQITNNAVSKISSYPEETRLEGLNGIYNNNVIGNRDSLSVWDQLMDPANRDFRPKPGSILINGGKIIPGVTNDFIGTAPDIGAYEYADENYWIPGYQSKQASHPIPPDRSGIYRQQVDLIWLMGYKSKSNDVYYGTNKMSVTNAGIQSTEFQGNQEGNIFHPSDFDTGKIYFWRIDAVLGNGKKIKGKVWSLARDMAVITNRNSKSKKRLVKHLSIDQNHPLGLSIFLELTGKTNIEIILFNIKGVTKSYFQKNLNIGSYVIPIITEQKKISVTKGIYFVKVIAGSNKMVQTVSLIN